MNSLGLERAVRYSLPPNQLGFCGPSEQDNRKVLFDFASGKQVSETAVRRILEKFEAMHPYLRLIARSNQISDPFDEKVVNALWVGNELLDNVAVADLRQMVATDFTKPGLLPREVAVKRAAQIPEKMVPHHSVHVFFLGSVTQRVDLKEKALQELCRIGWGKVLGVGEGSPEVEFQPIDFRSRSLGRKVKKEVKWDKALVPKVGIGDWVSFHWGRVCDLLGQEDVDNLERYTLRVLQCTEQVMQGS